MSLLRDMQEEPYRFDLLDVMRRMERTLGRASAAAPAGPDELVGRSELSPRPRLGDSASRRDEIIVWEGAEYLVSFGQELHLDFPASNVARVDIDSDSTRKRIRIYAKFLGMLGPQGALPFALTEEAWSYAHNNDHALPRFLDVFNQRFLQLFFRAWADSRPIVHNDRPDFDRFGAYVKSTIGVGSPAFGDGRHVPEGIGLYAGLLAPQAKSASRLRNALRGLFEVDVQIDEFVGTWLEFDAAERSKLGGPNSGLGSDMLLGKACYSVQDKFRIRVFVNSLERYGDFLPGQATCEKLVDLVFFYIGDEFEWDMEIALPAPLAQPVRLGQSGALGWTSWMAPNYAADSFRCDARFSPAERVADKRRKARDAKRVAGGEHGRHQS